MNKRVVAVLLAGVMAVSHAYSMWIPENGGDGSTGRTTGGK